MEIEPEALARLTIAIWATVGVVLLATVVAYAAGLGGSHTSPVSAAASTPPLAATPLASTPGPTPRATPIATLAAAQLQQDKPNELGEIMVLMFHQIDHDTSDDFATTPEAFRADLQWLYDHDFYVIPIHDLISNSIKAPAGKRPVVLTFDDGTVTQFRYIVAADGSKTIDPTCAVGILEDFFGKHPDFGRGGLFSIIATEPFAWPAADDQQPYMKEKVQWLIDHGYEIGNHTVHHADMKQETDEQIEAELAGAVDVMRDFSPQAQMEVIAVPFGSYPKGGDTTLFAGFDYRGKHYGAKAALEVGANPGPSPMDKDWDPMWIPRIRGTTDELDKWFAWAQDNPGILYVSDGNPDTITIPRDLPPALAGKLDEARAAGKPIIRY